MLTYRQKSVIYKTGSKPLKAAALTKLIIIENLNLQRKFHRLFTKLPKTTSSHACSFPLTNIYLIPHGEACGLTLDYFVRLNAHGEGSERVQYLANKSVPLGKKNLNKPLIFSFEPLCQGARTSAKYISKSKSFSISAYPLNSDHYLKSM